MTRDEMIAELEHIDEELGNEYFDLSIRLGKVLAALAAPPAAPPTDLVARECDTCDDVPPVGARCPECGGVWTCE